MNKPDAARLVLRRARAADLPEIVRLLHEDELGSKREAFTLPLQKSYLDAFAAIDRDPSSELIVGELDGRVIGTFQVNFITYLSFQGSKVAQIESVRIAKDLRGGGLGHVMMSWAIEKAREEGCHRVQLTTNKARKDAHRFYERLGFIPSHEGMKLYLG